MQNPGRIHIELLKRAIRYLKGTTDRGLLYCFTVTPSRNGVYGYYDAAHADDIDTRRSTMAYVFFFSGAVISWQSKLHTYVTTSTNHSEYCAAAKAAREVAGEAFLFTGAGCFGVSHRAVQRQRWCHRYGLQSRSARCIQAR